MLSLCSNVSAIKLQRQLNQNENAYSKAIERMTSGFKINSGADDAAGLLVATSLTSKLRGIDTVQGNIQGANAIMQIGQGSLETMSDMLLRIRDLALQSANGTNSLAQRVAMQGEVDSLLEEIIKQKNSAKFNDYSIFGTQTKLDKNKTYTDTNPIAFNAPFSTFSLPIGENSTEETVKNAPISKSSKEVSTFSMSPTQSIDFTGGECKGAVQINGKTYNITNMTGYRNTLEYSFDDITGEIMFNGDTFEISTKAGETNNIILEGRRLTLNAQNNDTIATNATYSTINGGSNHIVNGTDNTINGSNSNGNYTIYGRGNTINYGNGNNTISNNGSNNTHNGGSGMDVITNSGSASKISNIEKFIDNTTFNNSFEIEAGANFEFVYKGKSYMIEKNPSAKEDFGFSYSNNGDNVKFGTMLTTISTLNDTKYNITIEGVYNTINGNNTNSIYEFINGNNTFNGGSGNEIVKILSGEENKIFGGDGNDNISINSNNNTVYGGNGNDTFSISGNTNTVNGDNNDDIFNNYGTNNIFNGGSGNDTLYEGGVGGVKNEIEKIIATNTEGSFLIKNGETIEYVLDGKSYKITNNNGADRTFSYKKNGAEMELMASYLEISTANNTIYDLKISGGNNTINGNNKNSTYKINGYTNNLKGGSGNETIIVLDGQWNVIDGSDGDDNITVNTKNTTILGGEGNNTYTFNGDNNRVTGGGGNDTLYNYGINNEFNGSGGYDTLYEYGSGTVQRGVEKIIAYAQSGGIAIKSGQLIECVLGGKSYTIGNNSGADVILNYSQNGGEMELLTSGLTIATQKGTNYDLKITGTGNTISGNNTNSIYKINGDNNTLNGGAGAENITIQGGLNNTINGGGGDDNFTINSNGNTILGGDGDDNFTINGSSNSIFGNEGNDYFTNNGKDTTIDGGGGFNTSYEVQDSKTLNNINRVITNKTSGEFELAAGAIREYVIAGKTYYMMNNNASAAKFSFEETMGEIKFDCNNFNITGNKDEIMNIKLYGNNNAVTGGSAGDSYEIFGDNNEVHTGDGNNLVCITGNNNTAFGGNGDDLFEIIKGDGNEAIGGNGYDTIINEGTNSTYSRIDELQTTAPPVYFQTGTTSNSEESSVMVDIGFSLPIRKINVIDYNSAMKAINTVDGILSTLNDKLIKIGNAGVQLNSSYERNLTEETNLSASRSRIQDADIARESAELVKRQILKQSGSTLLNMCTKQNGDIVKSILLSSMK